MKVSALLSTYNNELYLEQTIESVLNQTYKEFEFIIVNDGSTDGTKRILDKYNDERLKIINLDRNIGISNALNLGLTYCTGEYIIKIDGDDIQHPERFEKQLKYMGENPSIGLSKCLFEYFTDDEKVRNSSRFLYRIQYDQQYKNQIKNSEQISESLKWHCCIPHTTIIVKTDLLKKYKYRNFKIFEDYDLFYRLNNDGILMGHLDEKLVRVRISAESTTAVRESSFFNEIAYEIKKEMLNKFQYNENIYIWGTGSYAKDLTKLLHNEGWKIEGYIDSFKSNSEQLFEGKPVLYSNIVNESKQAKVVIAATTGFYDIIGFLKQFSYETDKDFAVLR